MTLRLNGATSGYTEIDAPAVAGNNTLVLPSGNGSDGNILGTDGAGNLSWVGGRMVLETAKTATSTSVDFTGIPSWVKRVTVMVRGISSNGSSNHQFQLGAGSFQTSGYTVNATQDATSVNYTSGFVVINNAASDICDGLMTFVKLSGDTWIGCGFQGRVGGGVGTRNTVGSVTLSATLDRLRITTVNGTDTFDAGSVNILLEG